MKITGYSDRLKHSLGAPGDLASFVADPRQFSIEVVRDAGDDVVSLFVPRGDGYVVASAAAVERFYELESEEKLDKGGLFQSATEIQLGDGSLLNMDTRGDNEERWQALRRKMVSDLYSDDPRALYSKHVDDWYDELVAGDGISLLDVHEVTVGVLEELLFEEYDAFDGELLLEELELFARSNSQRIGSLYGMGLTPPLTGTSYRYRNARKRCYSMIERVVDEARERDVDDFVSFLLASPIHDEDDAVENLRDVTNASVAASALSTNCLFELGANPEYGRRIREDFSAELAENVFFEAARLHPVPQIISRHAYEDVTICGTDVPAGSTVFLPIAGMNRHPDHYEDPDEFRPGRFDGADHRNSYHYVPFGKDKRACIGREFAKGCLESLLEKLGETRLQYQVPARHGDLFGRGFFNIPNYGLGRT